MWIPQGEAAMVRERQPTVYDLYRRCPFMKFEFFLLRRQSAAIGCFMIGFAFGQARVVDLWLLEESRECYEAAYRLAISAARSDSRVAEVIAATSSRLRLEAALSCGFREYKRDAILVAYSGGLQVAEIDFQLLDNDAAFITNGKHEYVT
jgi:hypothetical protein